MFKLENFYFFNFHSFIGRNLKKIRSSKQSIEIINFYLLLFINKENLLDTLQFNLYKHFMQRRTFSLISIDQMRKVFLCDVSVDI